MTPGWLTQQLTALLAQRGHAWLLQGSSGLGQYQLALDLAQAWLCENPLPLACGQCNSCHAIQVRTHADLCVLMPEIEMIERAWPLGEKAQSEIDEKKRKPSREIRVEAMRDALEFCQRTSSRGRGKVVLVYPAECMNTITANTLLKTLEEPAGDIKFVLASEAAHQLLPTIRSRCLGHTMTWPDSVVCEAWLQTQGIAAADAPSLLRAAGGRPEDALRLACDSKAWGSLPKAMVRGDVSVLRGWTSAQAVDALQKLCHDMLMITQGAQPRFFEVADLPVTARTPSLTGPLTRWAQELARSARMVDHTLNTELMLEALVSQACRVLR